MVEVYVILAVIIVRIIMNSVLLANSVANAILKEKKAKRWLGYWIFIYVSDVLLMVVGIAALLLIF